ncbi:MAG: Smr/MutS family protein [Vicinamibacterales bacterium]
MSDHVDDDAVVVPVGAELDLHSFRPQDVASVVDEYVRTAAQAGFTRVRLVHGRGRGVQRGITQAALERHTCVVAFWDDPDTHLGATIADLAPR